jgi:hypothetical protein
MSEYTVSNTDKTFTISKNGENIFSFITTVTEFDYDKIHVHFMTSNGIDYAIYNTEHWIFSTYYFVNLKTKETKLLENNSKGGIVEFSNNDEFFIFTSYECGQCDIIYIYNFNCEEINVRDILDVKYVDLVDYSTDGIVFLNGKLTFNIKIDAAFLEQNTDIIDFDISSLTYKEYECYQSTLRLAIIPFLTYPLTEELISYETVVKIKKFNNTCTHREYVYAYRQIFVEQENIFKIFCDSDMTPPENTIITRDHSISEINLREIDETDIIDINCYGLYSGTNYMILFRCFVSYFYNPSTFYEYLLLTSLGSEWNMYKSVKKDGISNTIGLVFTITLKNKTTIEYTITMPLFELEQDSSRITYVKDLSIINILIRAI